MERANLKPRTRRARALRRSSTDVEHKLWAVIRNRQLEGFKFRRQVPIGRYYADFACLEARLVIELDGSQHMDRAEADERRTGDLEAAGWHVIRFWNNDVLLELDGVGRAILEALMVARA